MNSEEKTLSLLIAKQFSLMVDDEIDFKQFRSQLEHEIDYLINHNFEKLLWILYRIDVSEQKVKDQIATHPENAAEVIADLIIEHQMQKVKNRKNSATGFIDL